MSPLALATITLPALQQPPRGFSFSNSLTLGTTLCCSSSSSSICCSASISSTTLLSVYCGRGDKKTARGKRFNHSYGNARPRDKKKGRGPPTLAVPPAPRKDKLDDSEKIEIELDESLFSS